eukprot:6212277-Pleurochrysis_carterae.AAC.5
MPFDPTACLPVTFLLLSLCPSACASFAFPPIPHRRVLSTPGVSAPLLPLSSHPPFLASVDPEPRLFFLPCPVSPCVLFSSSLHKLPLCPSNLPYHMRPPLTPSPPPPFTPFSGHPVVGDRFCQGELAQLPRSCAMLKKKLQIECVEVRADELSPPLQPLRVEGEVPERLLASHWEQRHVSMAGNKSCRPVDG